MDIEDLPLLLEAFNNQDKLDQINYIIQCVCDGLMSHDEADSEIEKVIRSKNDEWKQ